MRGLEDMSLQSRSLEQKVDFNYLAYEGPLGSGLDKKAMLELEPFRATADVERLTSKSDKGARRKGREEAVSEDLVTSPTNFKGGRRPQEKIWV